MRKCIFNATVIQPETLLPHHAVITREDRIHSVLPMDALNSYDKSGEEMLYFDARGGYVMPGFIDIHSDYIEGVIQPRPTSLMDFETGLREAEKQLLGHGVTTIYHALSLMRDESLSGKKYSFRTRENLERLVGLIQDFHNGYHLIRHRFHARYEIDNLEIYDYLSQILEKGLVHELSFMDHTPGQGQYRDLEIYARSYIPWAEQYGGSSVETILAARKNKPTASHSMLKKLAESARARGVPLASHDDDTLEKLALMKNEYGIGISEFPIEMEVARKAHEYGLMVVVGAPNVVLGGSHSGNLSAAEAIRQGYADILCSDYYPSSLLHAAFKLEKEGILSLPQAVRMLTLNPAKAMGLDGDFGSVTPGKKADLLVVRKIQGCPMVYKCFIDGRTAIQLEYRVG
jgi:alpha-D-ribose 1-methylphosphonate 5-triphosphate diphosphatase